MLKLAREVQTSEAWGSYLQFAQIWLDAAFKFD